MPSAILKLAPSHDALLRADVRRFLCCALILIPVICRKESFNSKGTSLDLGLAHLTAYAPNLASLANLPAWLMIIARTHPFKGIRNHFNNMIRTDGDAFATSDTAFFINNDITFLIA